MQIRVACVRRNLDGVNFPGKYEGSHFKHYSTEFVSKCVGRVVEDVSRADRVGCGGTRSETAGWRIGLSGGIWEGTSSQAAQRFETCKLRRSGVQCPLIVDEYQLEIAKLSEFVKQGTNPLRAACKFSHVRWQLYERSKVVCGPSKSCGREIQVQGRGRRCVGCLIGGAIDGRLVHLTLIGKVQTAEGMVRQGATNEWLLSCASINDQG